MLAAVACSHMMQTSTGHTKRQAPLLRGADMCVSDATSAMTHPLSSTKSVSRSDVTPVSMMGESGSPAMVIVPSPDCTSSMGLIVACASERPDRAIVTVHNN